MLSTLFTSLKLKNTYWVNSRLYMIKRIPGLRNVLSDSIYSWGWMKSLFTVLGIIKEILSTFIYKFLFVFAFILIPLMGMGHIGGNNFLASTFNETEIDPAVTETFTIDHIAWPAFLSMFFFLTLVGGFTNNTLFDGRMDSYYATELLKLDQRKYTLSNYAYLMLRFVIGYIPVALILCALFDKSLWLAALIPLFVVGTKVTISWVELLLFSVNDKKGKYDNIEAGKITAGDYVKTFLIGVLFAAAYMPVAVGYPIPAGVTIALMIVMIALGVIGAVFLIRYKDYRNYCRRQITIFFEAMGKAKNAANLTAKKNIDDMPTATSDKKGFEFLNDIFIKRHKKLLWRSTKRITLISLGIMALFIMALIIPVSRDFLKEGVNGLLLNKLTMLPILLYFINKGRGFTQALFMNCDHSLLTYSFYKEPGNILHLFRLRLVEISKVNLLPAAVIGAGLMVILYLSGGASSPIYYPIVFLTVTGISVFFSIHYLVMYYLLQPYNSETEAKSGVYSIVMFATYFVTYFITQQEIPTLIFGLVVIGFCVLYSVIALILAYKLAPKTFRIKT